MKDAPPIRIRRARRWLDLQPCWVVWVGKEKWAVLDSWASAMQVANQIIDIERTDGEHHGN